MDEIPLASLEEDAAAFDAAALASRGVDHYCSSSAWVVPAHAAFHARNTPLVLRSSHGFAALARGVADTLGRYMAPLEAMWGLACPLLGADPARLARDFYRAMNSRRAEWDAIWLAGLEARGPLFEAVAALFATTCTLRWGPVSNRYAASLAGGVDAFLARRSPKFRANLRRAVRQAAAEGVTFDALDPASPPAPADLYARVLAVEARSWKGLSGAGIDAGDMRTFYDRTLALIVPRGQCRAVFARKDGEDVGFIFGGVLGDTYRGLQVSFDDRFRALSLGNVLHHAMIERLCAEGIGVYDLGSEIEYKARWAEGGISTCTLVALRR
ncbi:MAG: GNAT family N-acetyltransferase [Myxococcales bacterium]|nr:GNAT family N-acetyltransferase [Myxococcales bacterium]